MPPRRKNSGRPPARRTLARLLQTPDLARVSPGLPPDVLQGLIRHAGLERCVTLVESANPEQLTAVLDVDLWRASQPGGDEDFDADRFGEWLEALVAHDPATAARVVSRFDRSVLVTGLSQFVRVLDPGVLEPTESTDDEAADDWLHAADRPTFEVGGYILQVRREESWGAIVPLLAELSAAHGECFHDVMRGCRQLSNAGSEQDGLDELLAAPEQLRHDVALGRDDRRAARGFTSPADARAFLALARRRAEPHVNVAAVPAPADRTMANALVARGGALRPLMEYLAGRHPDVALTRGRELASLANALMAGCRLQSRSFTPQEASQAVVATCSLGLLRQSVPPDLDYLVGRDLIAVFQKGWAALHHEVSLAVAERLLAVLRGLRPGRSDTLDGLRTLQRSLEMQLAARTPWLARDALDVLATLDTPAWHGLCGLLSECPVIPEVVTAIVERRTGRVDANAFTFIATATDLDAIRAFMARVPALLAA